MWHRSSKIDRLKAIERAEIDEATEEWARRQLQPADVRLMGRAKWLTRRLTVVGALLGALGTVVGWVAKGVGWWRARAVAPAQLPATHQPTTAEDFVDKPKPEK